MSSSICQPYSNEPKWKQVRKFPDKELKESDFKYGHTTKNRNISKKTHIAGWKKTPIKDMKLEF